MDGFFLSGYNDENNQKVVADATNNCRVGKSFFFGFHDRVTRPAPESSLSARKSGALPVRPRATTRSTREEHSQETAQDYVELIAALIESEGEARVIDLARHLGVSHVTVSRTIQRLKREGLVHAQPYRSIFLTDAGRRLAEESRHRHEVVVRFLMSLGIPEEVAESDAEGIEHHVSKETLDAFVRHLEPKKRRLGGTRK